MSLAIVIPAYKTDFLQRTLASCSRQSNKNFTIYIGDDNSPHDIKTICDKFSADLNIHYTRFKENFGSINLVNQWQRCIALTHEEEWIWLFSDDDVMEFNCVDEFYKTLSLTKEKHDIYRFNTAIIDEKDQILYDNPKFPVVESSLNFLNKKLTGKIRSFVTEYIFSRQVYIQKGGFTEFPLAWASDDATWINFGFEKGIYTLPHAKVYWRLSNQNISSISNSHGNTKCQSLILFAEWSFLFFKNEIIDIAELKNNFKRFILDQINRYKISMSPVFLFRLFINLKKVIDINFIEFSAFILRKKILHR